MPARRHRPPSDVVVVSENPETIDGLETYLGGAGIVTRAARTLRAMASAPRAGLAAVVFPDGFEVGAAASAIASLRASQPRLLIVVVSSAPQRYREALAPDGRSLPPVVLPKPAFGWTILDAVRAHARAEAP